MRLSEQRGTDYVPIAMTGYDVDLTGPSFQRCRFHCQETLAQAEAPRLRSALLVDTNAFLERGVRLQMGQKAGAVELDPAGNFRAIVHLEQEPTE